MIPEKQPRVDIQHVNVSPVSTPASSPGTPAASPDRIVSPLTSPYRSPVPSPSPASSTSQENAVGVKFVISDNVCVASGKSYDFATVNKVWKTRVDITYLKKSGTQLNPWKLPGGKLFKDSVHVNSIFYCLGKTDSVDTQTIKKIKSLLSKLFE